MLLLAAGFETTVNLLGNGTVLLLRVRAGALIVLLLGGANRDPALFPNPHEFDVRRAEAGEHLAFSSGAHYCIGAALARIEGEVGLQALFRRFPDLALAGTPHRRPTRVLRGDDRIPVSHTRVTSAASAASAASDASDASDERATASPSLPGQAADTARPDG